MKVNMIFRSQIVILLVIMSLVILTAIPVKTETKKIDKVEKYHEDYYASIQNKYYKLKPEQYLKYLDFSNNSYFVFVYNIYTFSIFNYMVVKT